MQRQRSILSFFQKPLPASKGTAFGETADGGRAPRFPAKEGDANGDVAAFSADRSGSASTVEVRGTDTPPEKVPRRVLSSGVKAGEATGSASSLFSSIMHKFAKVDDRKCAGERSEEPVVSTDVSSAPVKTNGVPVYQSNGQPLERDRVFSSNGTTDRGSVKDAGVDDDVLGPETPGMRPRVPRLKRVQEDGLMLGENKRSMLDSSKRLKLIQDPVCGQTKKAEDVDGGSKFEWLDPSRIKDANGRRPGDPLYDKKTLYIPPDTLRKMSASRKQYWSVKSQYMDVVLFFKVGKFYELYELDAEIGHKELDWKMTMSGVGKCRQVGISESGIDDAMQKLVARG